MEGTGGTPRILGDMPSSRANTRAIALLQEQEIDHTVHEYELDVEAETYGEAVALQLGVAPSRLFKTLIATVDGDPVMAIVPVDGRLSLKALAKAVGGKKADLADRDDAERWTGYVTGGISPLGQRKRLPAFADESIMRHETVFASAGMRGLQMELAPTDLVDSLRARLAPLADD